MSEETSVDRAPVDAVVMRDSGFDHVLEDLDKKTLALEWAIHSCNKKINEIREHDILTDEQKQRQIEAHESYLRTLLKLRGDAEYSKASYNRIKTHCGLCDMPRADCVCDVT